MTQKEFELSELKYIISLMERDKIIKQITPFMDLDKNVKNNHSYEVRSLYFDSPFGKSYYKKKSGLNFRTKLRIRYYPDFSQKKEEDYVFVELKRRLYENLLKLRIKVLFDKAIKIINNKTQEAKDFYKITTPQNRKILNEIWYNYNRFHLKPVSVVCYKRQAFNAEFISKFRMTFDTDIKVRNYNFNLHDGGGSYYIKSPNVCIMEIKFNKYIPYWAINIVQTNNFVREKMSKYVSGIEKLNIPYHLSLQKKIFNIID